MGVYIGNKVIKLRFTKRGTRVGVGPRWLRFRTGAGGDGVSTGPRPSNVLQAATSQA
jgi:hypothetical protein